MTIKLENWRKEELGINDVIKKYPDVSRFVILKTDVQRRGYALSDKARELFDPDIHQSKGRTVFINRENINPSGLILRDGTLIVGSYTEEANFGIRDPYLVDVVNGKLVLTDQGEVLEEVEYWRKPHFFDKLTSKGNPMWQIVGSRPQRFDIALNKHCHFWDKPGGGCKYCTIGSLAKENKDKNISNLLDIDEVFEAVQEGLKQKGRFTTFCLTMGSILTGEELFDHEIQLYVDLFSKLKKLFKENKIHAQIVGSAYSKKQLEVLRDKTGVISYTTDLEVLNPKLFEWICPGKAEFVGYNEWKKRLYDAVEVFGKGNVNTGIVGGVDLAQPYGYKTEAESLKANFAEAEELAKHGVSVINSVWHVSPGTYFHNQIPPSLEYYVQLSKGLNDIREAYGIDVYFDDYRRCGNHPSSDLARI
ncbi:radical SAM protein [Ruminiclostridium josui]|uniref:radical SAM protein n=1 Tax=Ruminiclostridium josui TaxID=1499 RepID=UPI000463E547|nr:radical SAM protein [Ruminiclostridium josui]